MKTDIQIAQEATLQPIKEVAATIGIEEEDLELYGKYKAKISDELIARSHRQSGRKTDSGDRHQSNTSRRRKNDSHRGIGSGICKTWEKSNDCVA